MVGTSAIFYRTIVTQSLLNSLNSLTYPKEETTVFKFIPPVPASADYPLEGMVPVGNRRVVLQCFEALKHVIDVSLFLA